MLDSRDKGGRGEREVRDIIRKYGYEKVERWAQRSGGRDVSDIKGYHPELHLEVKFRERAALSEWLQQAECEAEGAEPVVVYRRTREPWRAVVGFYFFLSLVENAVKHGELADVIKDAKGKEGLSKAREEVKGGVS